MKSFSLQTTPARFSQDIEKMNGMKFQILLLFTSTKILKSTDIHKQVRQKFPDGDLIGCSTSGEIGEGVDDDSITLLGLAFTQSPVRIASVPIKNSAESLSAGENMAQQLIADDLAGVFVLLPGVNVNGSKFTQGLKNILPGTISISGGLAGDGLNFQETLTLYNDEVSPYQAIAFGIYGDRIKIQSGSRGGWKPFGPLRRVTKAEDNILYELDGKSALSLYKEYLGEKAADLPSSGLLYPFAIMDTEKQNAVGLIRTILDIDEENGSLILAGDLSVGQQVCLMHANTDELVDGAERAAEEARGIVSDISDHAIICVSCVGRKILMGDDTEDELDAVREVFGNDIPVTGFYSYGEICRFQDTGEPELHNQTMTITYIYESAA